MLRKAHPSWILLAALLALSACGGSGGPAAVDLPAIPEIRVEAFPEAVRGELKLRVNALQASPSGVQANGDLAMLAHAYQQLETAETLYARTVALEPSALRWRYYLGVVRSQQGKAEEAAESFEAGAEIDGALIPLRHRLAEVYMELNRLEEAAELYSKLLEGGGRDPVAHYGMGRVLAAQGESEAAIAQLLAAVELDPRYGAAHYELSLAYRDLGRVEEAKAHLSLYEQNANSGPSYRDPLMAEVQALRPGVSEYVARSVEFERKGQLAEAIAEHVAALRLYPDVAQLHVNLVSLYGRTNDFTRASEHYRRALELNPDQADLHYNYGVLQFHAGRYDDARKAFERAVEANPDYAAAHNNLGQLYERENRIADATKHYRAAIRANPDYRLARFHLGRMLLGSRKPAEAAKQFESALTPRDELTPQILFGLTAARVQLGDRPGALKAGEEARKMAEQMGQLELARSIEKDLASIR